MKVYSRITTLLGKELNVKLIGHYRYYGVTWIFRKITTFLHRVQQFLFKAMNRRGCRRAVSYTHLQFHTLLREMAGSPQLMCIHNVKHDWFSDSAVPHLSLIHI